MRARGIRFCFIFLVGAVFYPLLEVFWRGYTHFSMAILGGLCFFVIYTIHEKYFHFPLFLRGMICAFLVAVFEFICGLIVNIWLSLGVWDYSREYMNLYGQVCLSYFLVWFVLSIACSPFCRFLKKFFKM